MNKRDLIKFYTYLDKNDYLKEEYRTGNSMINAIKNFIKALPNEEATSVSENEEAKEVLYEKPIEVNINNEKIYFCNKCFKELRTG